MPASDTSGKSIKSMRQPSKIATALKRKASKVISTIVPKKKKKTLTGDTLSVSSIKSVTTNTEQSSDKDSSSQPTVIDIDSDEEVENPEEDPDVELGKVMA
jgi:hypothetical protein